VLFGYAAGHLDRVTISCPGDPDLYAKLGNLLAQKFGPATPRGQERQEWRFPTTVVELDGSIMFRAVTVNYYPTALSGDATRKP